jgi:hypothetical protein
MHRIKKFYGFFLSSFSIFALIGLCLLYAQVHTQGKPPNDSDLVCDNDEICEWEEAKSSTSKEECEDCQVKTYPPLSIEPTKQVATTGAADFSFSKGKIFQFKWIEEEKRYRDTWASQYLDAWTRTVSIGDADNDDKKEIITVLEFESGRGKNARRYQKIFLFEDESDGSPDWESPEIPLSSIGARDSIIADADNDGKNEIVIVNDMRVEIYRITFISDDVYDFEFLWSSPDYENIIWSVDVGDADSDSANEVVLAMSDLGAAIVYEHLGYNSWGNEVMTESIGVCNINYVKVRDADNDGYNEIVGGGSPRIWDGEACGDLAVWKFDGIGSYCNVFQDVLLSEEFIQAVFIQGVDVGDVDGDLQNEVVIGTASADVDLNLIYIYEYDGYTYVKQEPPLDCSGIAQLSVGNIDNDDQDEIVAASHGITIFDYVNGEGPFNFAYGGYLEID